MTDTAIASPCVGICKLDQTTATCIGCLRTVDEIAAWRDADSKTRLGILLRVAGRRSGGRPAAPNEASDAPAPIPEIGCH
jgi:predicted Fe-S protein YdhL (DUF1289 family)